LPKHNEGVVASNQKDIAPGLSESGNVGVWTDNELMQAIAEADTEAFALLMGRHVPTMTALARRITLNFHDADEVVQEAFLRVWTHAPRWRADGPAQFRTWLQRIVTNLAIDRCRKPKALPLEAAGDPPDPARDAESGLQAQDEARIIREAMARLPEHQRAAIALYYFDEMSAAQVAEVLDKTVGSTEVLLTRARHALRSLLTNKGFIGKEKGGHNE